MPTQGIHLKSAISHLNLNDHSLHMKMILENINNNVGELVGRSIVAITSDSQASRSKTKLIRFELFWCSSWRVASYLLIQEETHDIGRSLQTFPAKENKKGIKLDIRATNILLQGILKDIYTLINHYTDAKDIWDNVKMILEGSELTKDDRESQLYDEFERLSSKGETIHVYL
ncbi:hypothetical protein Tco_1503311 [Tanacetum coccineum]